MTTTLRLFYARAIPALMFLAVLLFLLMLSVGVSVAQELPPIPADEIAAPVAAPAPETTTKDLIDLVFSSAAAGAMSLGAVLVAFLARHLPKWMGPILDYITTSEADRWERLVTNGLDRAEAYARTKFDAVKDRAGYVNAMATFLAMFNREIVAWADKDGNGIIDLIETRLPPAPNAPAPKPAAMPVQPLMATPLRRKSREAVQ
jgi:hypothetical protein